VLDMTGDADADYFVSLMGDGGAGGGRPPGAPERPGLHHVLLDPRVRVFEPLWTVLPTSKAILAVLWQAHPGHPALLRSSFALTPELATSGYVSKPVNGRGSKNVELHAKRSGSAASAGADAAPAAEGATPPPLVGSTMFQELCLLPRYDDHFVQVRFDDGGGEGAKWQGRRRSSSVKA